MLACAVGAVTSVPALPALAQQASGSGGATIEEVVVTARKREESLQTVPVAVSSQTGQQLQQQRIVSPTDLTRITPSLQIRNSSSSVNSAQIALRGQYAADSLLGISQPVGLYEDNVNIPHPFGANNSFVDIARVEVLKGPQGTLYGRNTTGGAINIITRDADYAGLHGFIEGELGNYNNRRVLGVVNATVIPDKLAIRVAYQHWDKQGFGKSIVTGQHFGDKHDDDLARVSVKFDPFENYSANLKFEYGKTDNSGPMLSNPTLANPADLPASAASAAASARTNAFISEALWSNFALYGPLLRRGFGGDTAALGQVLAAGQALLAPCVGVSIYRNCSATHQFDRLKTWHFSLDQKWDVTDNVTLRSITGGHHFRNVKNGDLDGVQAQILEIGYGSDALLPAQTIAPYKLAFALKPDQESTQWSQEFNLSGKYFEDALDWMVGVYGSWDKGKGAQQAGALEELTAFAGQLADGRVLGEPGDDGATGSPLIFSHDGLVNKNSTWALYTQNDIHFSKRVSLTLGARYTEERLRQDLSNWHFTAANQGFLCDGAAADGVTPNTFAIPRPGDPDSCAESVNSLGPDGQFSRAKFSGTSYLASFNFQATDATLFYLKTARGFRGGAFGRASGFAAAPEFVTDYELGFKSDFFDRRLRTNLALYQSNYDNKQVSALVCIGGAAPPCGAAGFTTVILNAATARVQGAELEFQARPIEPVSIYGSGSYTRAKYTDWPNAVSGDGVPIGNGAGQAIAVTPTWQGAIGARYEADVGPGVLGLQADLNYRGKTPLTLINDQMLVPDSVERKLNGAVTLLNARLEYKLADMGLTGSVWVTNLTDKKYGYEGISANYTGGLSTEIAGAPRTYGVTLRKTFGDE